MCFTGGFALGMMVDDVVVAPVLSQPSLPFPVTKAPRGDVGLSAADLARVQERAAAGTCVLGLRFTGDKFSPPERFEHLRELLGDAFVGVELDSSAGQPPRAQEGRPLGAHRGPRRPAGHPDPGRARPGPRRSSPSACSGEPAWPRRGRPAGATRDPVRPPDLHRRHPAPGTPSCNRRCSSSTASPPRRSTSTGWSTAWPPTAGCSSSTCSATGCRTSRTSPTPSPCRPTSPWPSSTDLGVDRLGLLTHDVGDTLGGELLARQLEGAWDVEITDRALTNGSIYIDLAQLSAGPALPARPARRAAARRTPPWTRPR